MYLVPGGVPGPGRTWSQGVPGPWGYMVPGRVPGPGGSTWSRVGVWLYRVQGGVPGLGGYLPRYSPSP